MTNVVAIVGGPLLLAVGDLIRRRNNRELRAGVRGFPALPFESAASGRSLVNTPVPNLTEIPVTNEPEVIIPAALETAPMDPEPNRAPAVESVDVVPRIPRIPAPILPFARPMPAALPNARFLAYPAPRGFGIDPQ